jgi:hypothetical protein
MTVTCDARSSLDSVQYLYLRVLLEPRDNALRIVVQEAICNREKPVKSDPDVSPELNALRSGAFPIESTANCKTFMVEWKHYVAYLVTEECVGSCGSYDDEIYTGRLFRTYTQSHFLDHLAHDTGGHFEPLEHHKLICLNHLIDVVATKPPTISIIDVVDAPAADASANRAH